MCATRDRWVLRANLRSRAGLGCGSATLKIPGARFWGGGGGRLLRVGKGMMGLGRVGATFSSWGWCWGIQGKRAEGLRRPPGRD